MTNLKKLAAIYDWVKAVFDAVFNGGASMLYKESLQYQIDRAGERTWKNRYVIGPFKGNDGKEYFTTPAQQAMYDAQALARLEAQVASMKGILSQVADSANKGVPVNIDYAKIEKMMPKAPEYNLVVKE